jgi:nucleoside-triphosphatase
MMSTGNAIQSSEKKGTAPFFSVASADRVGSVKNILLTGVPRIGKTTVIESIAAALGDRVGGIITREIREGGRRTGFSIESLDGERRVLASRRQRNGPRVGPYGVNVGNLEAVGIRALDRALKEKSIIIIDEIGKMELISAEFRAMIMRALDSRIPVVATLGIARNPFLDGIRGRTDVSLIEVTNENRMDLPRQILKLLEGHDSTMGDT